jgi:sulfatase maturation enzyme AslB (radical SAM superfamily)
MYQSATIVNWMRNASNKTIIPASVDIDLTNLCNQDCFYCNSAEFRAAKPGGFAYTKYIDLIDKLHTWRAHSPNSVGSLQTVTYAGGGEPTLIKGFEKVIEHTLDYEFLTSITTNGFGLDKLVDHVPHYKLKKLGWIGVDIDAGEPILYEKIRKSLSNKSIFNRVQTNVKNLREIGVNVDFKVLLNELNSNDQALHDIFALAKSVKIRIIYFRPVLLNNQVFVINDSLLENLNQLSEKYQVQIKVNLAKYQTRNYSRCHQMFQFPIFCADGEIYVCCENKGNPQFSIGKWVDNDFRNTWAKDRHWSVYNGINTHLCPPCRPNPDNNEIQRILDNPLAIEKLYL